MKVLLPLVMLFLCGCDTSHQEQQTTEHKFHIERVGDNILPVRRMENKEVVCYQQSYAIWCYKKEQQ